MGIKYFKSSKGNDYNQLQPCTSSCLPEYESWKTNTKESFEWEIYDQFGATHFNNKNLTKFNIKASVQSFKSNINISIQNQINGLKINIFVVSKFNGSHNDFFSKNGEELFQINQLGENEISSKTIKSNIQKRMKKLKFSGTQSYQGLFFKEKLNYIIHTYGDKFYVYDACDKSRVMRGSLSHLTDQYISEISQGMDIRIASCIQISLLNFKCS
jgi:hypothetical protein